MSRRRLAAQSGERLQRCLLSLDLLQLASCALASPHEHIGGTGGTQVLEPLEGVEMITLRRNLGHGIHGASRL